MSDLTVYSVYADEDEDYGLVTVHEQDPDGLWVFASSAQEAIASLEAKNADLLAALESIVEMNPPLPMGMIEAALQAIAKAKGEKV